MKKILVSLFAFLFSLSALAVPAKPGVFTYTQPDGSVVRLERHGDEFFSWTTLAGTTQAVKLDADGFWRPVTIGAAERAAARERRMLALNRVPRTHTDNKMTHGTRHIPVLLVEFQDVSFTLDSPLEKFTAMLNETGYSYNGATGSVQDYYYENSHGQFQPVFDVYGPVTLPHDMAYYGEPVWKDGKMIDNDKQPELALYDACVILDDAVDFSQYDYDENGTVDMVLFYYAGYNTAEGGSDDAIWPHQWNLQGSPSAEARSARFDGKAVGPYFCTSELKGDSGADMCGIGTTCHEFGHSLGLPDFYDTNYDDNGRCSALGYFSIMASGSYNNDGRTPPYFNAEEKIYLGWMTADDILELPDGAISFGSVKDEVAYKSLTDVEGEYFLYECRDGSSWDAPLPKGLLVYHVDKSNIRSVGGHTPAWIWANWKSFNKLNAYGDHPCFYVVPASDQNNLYYTASDLGMWIFPGTGSITQFVPVDWNGNETGLTLNEIGFADGMVHLTALYASAPDPTSFGQMGFTAISDPGNGVYQAGDVFLLQLDRPVGQPTPKKITWKMDGEPVAEAVTLTPGTHHITAKVVHGDMSMEDLELVIEVK